MLYSCWLSISCICPEDRAGCWIIMRHIEVPDTHREYCPDARQCCAGISGQCLSRPRRASLDATAYGTLPFLSLYPFLAYTHLDKYDDGLKSEEWTFIACLSLGAGHALSLLAARRGDCNTRFHDLQECGIDWRWRLHSHRSHSTRRGRLDCMVVQERCRWRACSLLTNWLTILQSLARSGPPSRIDKIPTYFYQTHSYSSPHFHILHRKRPLFLITASAARLSEEQNERTVFI